MLLKKTSKKIIFKQHGWSSYFIVSFLNCDSTENLLYWTITLLNSGFTKGWLYWTLTWLNYTVVYWTGTFTFNCHQNWHQKAGLLIQPRQLMGLRNNICRRQVRRGAGAWIVAEDVWAILFVYHADLVCRPPSSRPKENLQNWILTIFKSW